MAKFLTSDQHYGHPKVLTLGRGRPFNSLAEMENYLVREHNKRVKPQDEVFHLGDFAYKTTKEEAKRILKRLNGIHYLCMGNHDFTAAEMLEIGFKDVFENRWIWLCDYRDGRKWKVFLSHYPYFPSLWYRFKCWKNGWHWDNRYLHKRIVDCGQWLLFGHTHQAKPMHGKKRCINIGVDANNFAPVSEKELIERIIEIEDQETFLDKLFLKLKARYM